MEGRRPCGGAMGPYIVYNIVMSGGPLVVSGGPVLVPGGPLLVSRGPGVMPIDWIKGHKFPIRKP